MAIKQCTHLDVSLPNNADEMKAICEGFQSKSTGQGPRYGCVGSLDGYLLRIKAPTAEECGGNVPAYYSGHYCYRLNVQALCDSECSLLFYSVAAPGRTNDAKAIRKTNLPLWINNLPPGMFAASDCAYPI